MLLERAERPPLRTELASHSVRSLPGSRLPWEGAWDDAMVLCPPQAPASGAALAGTAAATAREGERKKGRGAGKAQLKEEGRWGGKEQRGRESLSFAVPPPHLSPAGGETDSPSTPSPSSSPPSLPTLPPERAEGSRSRNAG